MASKLRVELVSLCNQINEVVAVKAGLDNCVEMCKDLLHKITCIQLQMFVKTRSSRDPLEGFLMSGIQLSRSITCLLYTSPSPRDTTLSRMPSSA